ncbi:MAG TPA: tyrosine-protein kinase family protein [Nitrospirae bacterium]|nr:tyrosine-protein kinase family protein [Nitrospirota bacterium]
MSRIEEILEKATKMRKGGGNGEKSKKMSLPGAKLPKVTRRARIENPNVVTVLDPDSSTAEEYRKLKSMVVRLTKSDEFQNMLMVTSSVGGEGKSLTALNLAITLAQEYDYTVLLVDADLRRPSLNEYLGIHADIGLTDCLVDGMGVGNALIKTGIGGLVYLPPGRRVSNPGDLLSSSRMSEIMKEIKHRYPDRYVIIDTPPVLPFAEVLSIGALVDGVIFVVREGVTSEENLKDAVGMLKNANILGAVYNAAESVFFDGHYKYKYSKYSSYYRDR